MGDLQQAMLFADLGDFWGPLIIGIIALIVIARGVFAIMYQSIRLRYGIQLEGTSAVVMGGIFIVLGIVLLVVCGVVAMR